MKKTNLYRILIAITICFSITSQLVAQTENDAMYHRSSLHTILLESENYLKKDLVESAYALAPFPDKYNDHRIAINHFDPTPYIPKGKAKTDDEKAEKELSNVILKYFNDQKIANQLVAKWFNRQSDGSFNMQLIHDRGSYNASLMEAEIAKGSIRGLAALKDAGEELIKNTFVVVNKMSFVENEPIAAGIRTAAIAAANQSPSSLIREAAIASANATYQATKDGYSVWTTSYLYQLEWNDDMANTFYMDMWMDSANIDQAKKQLFDTTSIFKLNYIGYEKAKSVVLIGIGRSERDVIQQATIRNIDMVYTKLQKTYDVFKTKTPIYQTDPIMAKIGLKEGIEDGDKFEVLEQTLNSKTGLTKYERIAVVKADGKKIWDNRYNMGIDDEKPANADLEGTFFLGGGKKIQPGMLLRQIK